MNVDLLIKENKELSEEKQRYKEMWFIANNSLAKYRKLEEQIGCSLEVVFKAMKNGLYDEHGNYYKTDEFNLKYDWLLSNPNDKYLIFDVEDTYFEFKLTDYKKTWWLKKDKSE